MAEMMDIEDEGDDEKRSDGMLNFSDIDQSPTRGNKSALHDHRIKTGVSNIFTRGNTI